VTPKEELTDRVYKLLCRSDTMPDEASAEAIVRLMGEVKYTYAVFNTLASGYALRTDSVTRLALVPEAHQWLFTNPIRYAGTLELAQQALEVLERGRTHLKEAPRGKYKYIGGLEIRRRIATEGTWEVIQ